jgi:hypothetical protein
MGFMRVPGLSGKVYVPEPCPAGGRKHACRDCFDCQRCSDDRCRLCRPASFRNRPGREEPGKED